MHEEFDFYGFWHLPNRAANRWWGSVSYNPEAGIILELTVNDGEEPPFKDSSDNVACLFGESTDSKHHSITLIGNRPIGQRIARKLTVYRYRADCLLAGKRYYSPSDSLFRWLDVSFSSLAGWMRSGSPILDEPDGDEISFSVRKTHLKQEFSISSIESRITLFTKFRDVRETSEHPLEGTNFIRIQPDSPQSLEWFSAQIDSLRGLIVFLAGVPMENKWIQGELDIQNADEIDMDIVQNHTPALRSGAEGQNVASDQTYAAYARTLETDRLSNYGMAFPFEHLETGTLAAADIFNNWFERIGKFEVPYALCLDVINNEHSFHEFEFLALVQALESYYQEIHRDVERPQPRRLLPELYSELIPDLQAYIALDDEFLTNVIRTRNYYTHHNPGKRENALKDQDLYDAITRLVAFVVAVLSKELGIPQDEINKAFERTEVPGLWARPR